MSGVESASTSRRPRRWFAFSLRTLLMFVTVAAVWIGLVAERAGRQREFVAALHRVGGGVLYDFQRSPDGDLVLDPNRPRDRNGLHFVLDEPPEPKWAIDLMGIDFFHHVIDACVRVDGVRDWEESVPAGSERMDDEWLAKYLPLATKLEFLDLRETMITDKGLPSLAMLPHLSSLDLGDTRVGDEGIAHLTKLKLECLYLDRTQVSDASISVISQMRTLTSLGIEGTAITEQGAVKLREALPHCDIFYRPVD